MGECEYARRSKGGCEWMWVISGRSGQEWVKIGGYGYVITDRVGMGDISNGLVCVRIQVQVWTWMNVATFWHIYNSR